MAVNKVIYGGQTLIDITDSTVTAENLPEGVVAYSASGERIVGTMVVYKRKIGEFVDSMIPLDDETLHALDGSLLSVGGEFNDAITKIASFVSSNPGLFTTESEWQASVTAYGICGKFVYTAGVSLRLPKMNNLSYIVVR